MANLNQEGRIVWSVLAETGLRMIRPTQCLRLANGNSLIEHSNRSRWLELTPQLEEVWRYSLPLRGFEASPAVSVR